MVNVGNIKANRLYRLFFIALMLVCFNAQAGDIYRCIDDGGGSHFQDTPCHAEAKPYKRWIDQTKPDLQPKALKSSSEPSIANLWDGERRLGVLDEKAKPSRSFMWRASKKGRGTVYLMGSIHFGRPDMYPLSPNIRSAFEASNSLMVELNALTVNPLVMGQLMAEYGMYQGGDQLKNHLSHQTWARISKAAARLNVPSSLFSAQKPWLAAMTLSVLSIKQSGFSESLGIDMHFLEQAQGRMNIIELEGMEYQVGLMANLSKSAQLAMLEDALRILDEGDEYFGIMLDLWQSGDADGMAALIEESVGESSGAKRLMKRLLDDRNARMLKRIEGSLVTNQTSFIVVGAAHLVGPKGLISMFASQGYEVEQH